jgi:hypothetical protein
VSQIGTTRHVSDHQAAAERGVVAMQPTRDPRVTLSGLVEVLLNKGVYLNLDLIVTVADIPLIGVNLRTTIAGIETMLEYGMMRSWDERTRAWVRNSISRDVPLFDGEEVVAKMAGGHRHDDDFGSVWRPGTLYLTSMRLLVFRRDPPEVLWQAALRDVQDLALVDEPTVGNDERQRLHVRTGGGIATLSPAKPQRLYELLTNQLGPLDHSQGATKQLADIPLLSAQMWYHEPRSSSAVWRGGRGTLERSGRFTWKGALDARPAVRIDMADVTGVRVESGGTPTGTPRLILESSSRSVVVTTDDVDSWSQQLSTWVRSPHESGGTDGGLP